jgi:hypothetical protein
MVQYLVCAWTMRTNAPHTVRDTLKLGTQLSQNGFTSSLPVHQKRQFIVRHSKILRRNTANKQTNKQQTNKQKQTNNKQNKQTNNKHRLISTIGVQACGSRCSL